MAMNESEVSNAQTQSTNRQTAQTTAHGHTSKRRAAMCMSLESMPQRKLQQNSERKAHVCVKCTQHFIASID